MLIIIQISNVYESIPNRSTRPINGIPAILYLIERLKAKGLNQIVIATSTQQKDDMFEEIVKQCSVSIYRGSLADVIQRFIDVCNEYNVSNFVKINGNYPFVDIDLMKNLYVNHVNGSYDYSYNEHLKGVIWGMGSEIYNVNFLKTLSTMKLTDSQKQTIGIYIRQNQDRYKVFCHSEYIDKRPNYKLSLESEKDYAVIEEIAHNVSDINTKSVSDFLKNHPITAAYNLESRPQEAGVEKIFLNLSKAEHIINGDNPDLSYPISVEMTLTNACNMNCVYCSDAMLRQKQGAKEMISLHDFQNLFQDLAHGGTKGIVIEGGGEPTLYSHFNDVVESAKSYGLALGLITNGSRRLDKEVLESFEWIRVSLDASTTEEYKALKGVDFYERVIDNIAYYAQFCQTVGVGYVVTTQNISQIEPLVMRLRELKASYIQLRPVVDNEKLYPKDIDLSYLKFYMNKNFGVQMDGMIENATSGNHGLPCSASSITSVISGDGSVYICGRLNIYDWLKPIGNITRESFHEIWYGEERKKQLLMINEANFCQHNCPQCRISKFNVLFNKIKGIKSVHFI